MLVSHGLVPSAIGHVAFLVWLAVAHPAPLPGTLFYEIDLEPSPERAEAASPADSAQPTPPTATLTEPAGETEMPALPATRSASRAESTRGSSGPPPAWVPPAAEAGHVLTAPEGANTDADGIDFSMVQGQAERYAGGVTTRRGTSLAPVYDARARDEGVQGVVNGRPGGTGSGEAVRPQRAAASAPEADRSRAPEPVSKSWQCPFPAAADAANVNFARVQVVVTVGVAGNAERAVVLSDPGNGFAAVAQRCALGQRYIVGLDAKGNPRVATTAPITVTFIR